MKISIISTYDIYGGASLAAYRLHKGLRSLNHDSAMIVRHRNSTDPGVYKVTGNKEMDIEAEIFKAMQIMAIDQNRTDLSNTLLSLPYPGYDLSRTGVIHDADIINLHWVTYFQSVEGIASLLKCGKPVVWTLHDQGAFTGGCHYAAGCLKYREDCRDCPQLKDNYYQIPFHVLNNKLKHWQQCRGNLVIVTPSQWLAACARESRLFKGLRVETIPNSLETDDFKPMEKKAAKKKWGLGPAQTVLLFGALTGKEKRKGFHHLVEALRYCLRDPRFKGLVRSGDVKILTFGPAQGDVKELGIAIRSLGTVAGNDKLASIYSAADLFVLPSLEDNLPNTMLESMACGTPVVSFAVGGMPDLIQNGVTGGLAPCFDVEKFGQILLDLVFDTAKREQMGRDCRQVIEKNFKLQDQAGKYLELFSELSKVLGGVGTLFQKGSDPPGAKEILLDEGAPLSMEGEGIFEIYRKSALRLLITEREQWSQWQKKLRLVNKAVKSIKTFLKKLKNGFR